MIRIRLDPNHRHCTVHEQPSWLARLFGAEERDFEAWRIRSLSGGTVWVDCNNREVSGRVCDAIERAAMGGR